MEAAALLGGRPSVSSSPFHSQTQRQSHCSLSVVSVKPAPLSNHHGHRHLAAFRSASDLFSYSPFRPRVRSTKPRIFLPHLVASMVILLLLPLMLQFSANLGEPHFNSPLLHLICYCISLGILLSFLQWFWKPIWKFVKTHLIRFLFSSFFFYRSRLNNLTSWSNPTAFNGALWVTSRTSTLGWLVARKI